MGDRGGGGVSTSTKVSDLISSFSSPSSSPPKVVQTHGKLEVIAGSASPSPRTISLDSTQFKAIQVVISRAGGLGGRAGGRPMQGILKALSRLRLSHFYWLLHTQLAARIGRRPRVPLELRV